MDARTSFLKHDLTRPTESGAHYDLAVSNLVFHNMGKKRFKAYGTVFDALKPEDFSLSAICSRTTKPIWTISVNARR